MNNLSKLTFLLLPLLPLTACEDKGDELEVVEQPVPEGFALSAGNSRCSSPLPMPTMPTATGCGANWPHASAMATASMTTR